jgi:DNA-directed RNA polymerase specialized sigma subunit
MQLLVTKEQLSPHEKTTLNKAERDKLIIDYLHLVKYLARKIVNSFFSNVDQIKT